MSLLFESNRREKATYWAPGPVDGYGKQTLLAPVEIDCRWENRHEQFIDVNNQERVSKAVVYTDREAVLAGMMFFGELTSAPADPLASSDCWEVQMVSRIPNIKAEENWFSVML